jgi:hypothetical protein
MNEMRAGEHGDWTSLDGEDFVRQAYQRLLERPADLAGLHNYTAQLMAGMPKAQLIAELENSPEGRMVARRRGRASGSAPVRSAPTKVSTSSMAGSVQDLLALTGEQFVRRAYLALLGRESDPSGLKYYTERLARGDSREQVIADLCADPEGQAYGSRIAGLQELLGRLGESHTAPKVDQAADLLALHGTPFVKAAYRTVLGREADPAGLAHYVELLRSGYSRSHILAALAGSPEARSSGQDLPGLQQLVRGYRKGQARSWGGWYWRNVKGVESDLPPAREARRLSGAAENR